MDIQKEIEKMAMAIPDVVTYGCTAWDLFSREDFQESFRCKKAIAKAIVEQGLGNIKGIIKEAVEDLADRIKFYFDDIVIERLESKDDMYDYINKMTEEVLNEYISEA